MTQKGRDKSEKKVTPHVDKAIIVRSTNELKLLCHELSNVRGSDRQVFEVALRFEQSGTIQKQGRLFILLSKGGLAVVCLYLMGEFCPCWLIL